MFTCFLSLDCKSFLLHFTLCFADNPMGIQVLFNKSFLSQPLNVQHPKQRERNPGTNVVLSGPFLMALHYWELPTWWCKWRSRSLSLSSQFSKAPEVARSTLRSNIINCWLGEFFKAIVHQYIHETVRTVHLSAEVGLIQSVPTLERYQTGWARRNWGVDERSSSRRSECAHWGREGKEGEVSRRIL